MCMDCFNTLGGIKRQRADRKPQERCDNCKYFSLNTDFFVFGNCDVSGREVAKNHVCDHWIRR